MEWQKEFEGSFSSVLLPMAKWQEKSLCLQMRLWLAREAWLHLGEMICVTRRAAFAAQNMDFSH